jgi:hypothetical protein
MDVDTAFLNAPLTDDIYITQLMGFVDGKRPNYVCKLKKSLYSLKQSPYEWNRTFDDHLRSHGFELTEADPCVYVKRINSNIIIIAVYVDDCTIVSKSLLLVGIKRILSDRFKMKDLGEVSSVLGIEITRDRGACTLSL